MTDRKERVSRSWGSKPPRPLKGDRNLDLNLPFKLTDELSRLMYNELIAVLPNAEGIGFPYLVLHERDPRGIVSTFEFEGERYEVVVRRKEPR